MNERHHHLENEADVPFEEDRSLSRRGFGTASLAVGFAVAAGPVAASVISTDLAGIEAGMVEVPTADGKKMPAYRARPRGAANPPVSSTVMPSTVAVVASVVCGSGANGPATSTVLVSVIVSPSAVGTKSANTR